MGGVEEEILVGVVIAVAGTGVVGGWNATRKWVLPRVRNRRIERRRSEGELPDHDTIASGWYGMASATSSGAAFRVMVACAPSTKRSPARLDRDQVQAFVTLVFPNVVDAAPEYGNPSEVFRYRGSLPSSPSEAATVNVWATGLIEACVSISFEVDGDQACSVLLDDFVRAAVPLLQAVRAGVYRRVYGGPANERLDWRISISNGVTPSSWMALRSFRFDGRQPRSGPATTGIAAPASGLAVPELHSRSQADDPAMLLRPVLADLFDRGGYAGTEDALVDLLKHA